MVGASFKTVKGPPNLSPDNSSSTKLCLLGRIFRPGEKTRKLPGDLYLLTRSLGQQEETLQWALESERTKL